MKVLTTDIKPYNFEPLMKKVRGSINYKKLAAASADLHPDYI